MKTWIPWAIWMDKWCQNELKWRLEYHEQYGWTNDAKINSNEDSNPMSNMDGQMMPKWTQIEESNPMSNMDGQMMPKWAQVKTWIPWAIWMDKWCQNELKWRLESHEQYGWSNDDKMTQMKTWIPWALLMDKWCQNELKWTQMKTWISWAIWMDKWLPKSTEMKTWIPWAIWMDKWCQMNSNEDLNPMRIWMDKWCQNELKWRLESHEQYGWTNDAKMNSNEDLNPMSTIDGQMMPKWTQMNSNEDLNLMSNMDRQMMPIWTQMKTWIPWAIWMDKWCQNKLKWRLESHEQCGWINDDKWTQMKTWIPWAIWMDKWCQNELKWRLEYHEQYEWTNDAKINSNDDSNPMSNVDG